jgi:hypothetical protein
MSKPRNSNGLSPLIQAAGRAFAVKPSRRNCFARLDQL